MAAWARAEGLGGFAAAESGNNKMTTVAKMRAVARPKATSDRPQGLARFMAILPIQNVPVRATILPLPLFANGVPTNSTITTPGEIMHHIVLHRNTLRPIMQLVSKMRTRSDQRQSVIEVIQQITLTTIRWTFLFGNWSAM